LKAFTIPEPSVLTWISASAFEGCASLTTLTLPSTLTGIDSKAFFGSVSLARLIVPDSVNSIGTEAFYNCTDLSSLYIGSSVESIGDGAFFGCSNLTTVSMPNTTTIGTASFAETPCDATNFVPGAQIYNCSAASDYFMCVDDGAFGNCMPVNESNGGMGVLLRQCLHYDKCPNPYICESGNCIAANKSGTGVPIEVCEQTCLSPNPLYICSDHICVISIFPGRGVPKEMCIKACMT